MVIVEYSSNNSGGGWWLDDKDWKALEDAGWTVEWERDNPFRKQVNGLDADGERFLGALATRAHKAFHSLNEGIAEWERITGEWSEDEGCECCGQPHYFYEFDPEMYEGIRQRRKDV